MHLLLEASHLYPTAEPLRQQERNNVTELGFLALAIGPAGAYIACYECGITVFLSTLSRHRADLFQHNAYMGALQYERAV